MSDIVERLRDPKVYIPGEELLHEAADEITRLRAEVERLKAALREWENAVNVGVTAEGPIYIGVSSALGQKAWKLTRAALGDTHE